MRLCFWVRLDNWRPRQMVKAFQANSGSTRISTQNPFGYAPASKLIVRGLWRSSYTLRGLYSSTKDLDMWQSIFFFNVWEGMGSFLFFSFFRGCDRWTTKHSSSNQNALNYHQRSEVSNLLIYKGKAGCSYLSWSDVGNCNPSKGVGAQRVSVWLFQ